MLQLVEHFFSIQGEGRYTGVPSLFFRFGGCNMRCEGFGCAQTSDKGVTVLGCDTVYAVNKEHFSHAWNSITSVDQLISIVDHYEIDYAMDIVFTGGEPLLNMSDLVFVEFLDYLVEQGHKITFETNGSLDIDYEQFPVYKEVILALSVKLSNSAESYNKRVRPEIIYNLARYAKEAFFKFSINEELISLGLDEEIEEICSHAPNIQVYCMPVGGSKTEVEQNALPLIEYCKIKGYTYSDRLHIRIWDQISGV